MKKTKKISSLSFLVTIILIGVLATAMAVVVLDEQNTNAFAQLEITTKSSYDTLVKSINQLKSNVDKLTSGVNKMNGVDIGESDWESASAALTTKLDELNAAESDFFASFKDEKNGLNYNHYFNYVVDEAPVTNKFTALKSQAVLDLTRATSVKKMDEIIAKYKKDIDAIPTNLELLYAALASVEKNGIGLDDLDAYVEAVTIFPTIDDNIFALDLANEINEKLDIEEKIEEIHEALKPVAIDAFLLAMSKLPEETALITLKNEADVESSRKAYDILTDEKYGFYTVTELKELKNKPLHNAEAALVAAENHINVLNQMNGKLDEDTKLPIEGNNALWINAQIASYKNTKILANPATKLWIDQLLAYVSAWDNNVWESTIGNYSFELVTDTKNKLYSETIYNMIDRATLKKYLDEYKPLVEALLEEAEYPIYLASKLPAVTLSSIEEIENLKNALNDLTKLANGLKYEEIDYVIGLSGVEGVNYANTLLTQYESDYEALCNTVDALVLKIEQGMVKALKVVCTVNHGKDSKGNPKPCTCPYSEINASKLSKLDVEAIDADILTLFTVYGASEDYIDATILDLYKEARLMKLSATALANIESAYNASSASTEDKDNAKAALVTLIERIIDKDYTFVAKLVGSDYVLVESTGDNRAPSDELAKFTVDYCAQMFPN